MNRYRTRHLTAGTLLEFGSQVPPDITRSRKQEQVYFPHTFCFAETSEVGAEDSSGQKTRDKGRH